MRGIVTIKEVFVVVNWAVSVVVATGVEVAACFDSGFDSGFGSDFGFVFAEVLAVEVAVVVEIGVITLLGGIAAATEACIRLYADGAKPSSHEDEAAACGAAATDRLPSKPMNVANNIAGTAISALIFVGTPIGFVLLLLMAHGI